MNLYLAVSPPKERYTLLDAERFLSDAEKLPYMPLHQSLHRACEMVVAIPQNLLPFFRRNLAEAKERFDHSTWNWLMHIVKERMRTKEMLKY